MTTADTSRTLERVDHDVVRGHLESMILATLEPGPKHGYAVITAIKGRSGGRLELHTGSVYPALRRLEDSGYVRSSWAVVDGRKRRTYRLTAAGRRELNRQRNEWKVFTRTVGGVLEES